MMPGPLDAVRKMVAASRKRPGVITRADIRAEIARLQKERDLLTSLLRTFERLARLRYEDTAAPASKRGPKVK